MDTINIHALENHFGNTRQTIHYAGERYTEMEMTFDEPGQGSGSIRSVITPGMQLSEFYVHTGKPVILADTQSLESAESAFILSGDIESRFNNTKDPILFGNRQHNLQYNTDFSGEHIIHSDEFQAITISYAPDYLDELLHAGTSVPLDALRRSLEKKQRFLALPRGMQCSHEINSILHSIRHCRFQGLTRYLFMESNMMELFVLQVEQLHANQLEKAAGNWQAADRDRFFAVKEYLEQAYLEPLTLKEITSRFGLNEFKLKKGYKQLFQTTVFGHVHQLRMQKARQLLQEKEMNVSETAFFIGYNNVSSFSAEFKKRFGYNPSMQ